MKVRLLIGVGLTGLALTGTASTASQAKEIDVSKAIEENGSTSGRPSEGRGAGGARRRLMPVARAVVHRIARTHGARRLLDVALKDDETLAWTMWHLCDRFVLETSLARRLPARHHEITGLHDLTWLWSRTPLVQGASRLGLDEASYFYRLVTSLERPRVAEIGRFKGGTTFLLAAAGAEVFSLDIDNLGTQAEFDAELETALRRYGLADRVKLELGDSRTYPVEPMSFDVVFLDGAYSYEDRGSDFANWWPGVVPGGHLIVHGIERDDVRWPFLERFWAGNERFRAELAHRSDGEVAPDAPGSLTDLVKRSRSSEATRSRRPAVTAGIPDTASVRAPEVVAGHQRRSSS
jgi:Methyltransferase domain